MFDLALDSGKTFIDYSKNGEHLLLAGEKGRFAHLNFRTKALSCEMDLKDKLKDVKFLQSH
jgi:U3 small nucleolar RNA-associated protein 7